MIFKSIKLSVGMFMFMLSVIISPLMALIMTIHVNSFEELIKEFKDFYGELYKEMILGE